MAFLVCNSGTTMIEYGFLLGGISTACIGGICLAGHEFHGFLTQFNSDVTTVLPGSGS
jgi:Flp pilus assembly pilin Flp